MLLAREVARMLRVPEARVYDMARQGLIPTIRLGRQLRFDEQQLAEWAAKGGRSLPGVWRRELDVG